MAVIVTVTVVVGYSREYQAQAAAGALRARIRVQCTGIRDGSAHRIPVEEVVPGDLVDLTGGSLVPADALVVDATDFYVSEAVLTGESLPATKRPGIGRTIHRSPPIPRDSRAPSRIGSERAPTRARSGWTRRRPFRPRARRPGRSRP